MLTSKPNSQAPTAAQIAVQAGLSNYAIAATVYSAAMDFALVGMAWSVVSRIKMRSKKEKFGVAMAMCLGGVAGVTSIVKAAILPTLGAGDITFVSASLHIWSIAEPSVTIIAASIPLLRVLLVHIRTNGTTRSRAVEYARSGQSGSGPGSGKGTTRSSVLGSAKRGSHGPRFVGFRLNNVSDDAIMLESVKEVEPEGTADGERSPVDVGMVVESRTDDRDETPPSEWPISGVEEGTYGRPSSGPDFWPGQAY